MPYIDTQNEIPGIRGLMEFRPEAAQAMNALAQVLLVTDEGLTRAERELIASYISSRNSCAFCMTTHGAIAAHLPGCDTDLVRAVWDDADGAPLSAKMKSLLHIADKVRISGREVQMADIEDARSTGATDLEIHDTVLISAAFCMFNRYVDGLGATTPDDPVFYQKVGAQRASEGYMTPSFLTK